MRVLQRFILRTQLLYSRVRFKKRKRAATKTRKSPIREWYRKKVRSFVCLYFREATATTILPRHSAKPARKSALSFSEILRKMMSIIPLPNYLNSLNNVRYWHFAAGFQAVTNPMEAGNLSLMSSVIRKLPTPSLICKKEEVLFSASATDSKPW